MTILDEIFTHKRKEVAIRKQERLLAEVRRAAEMAAAPADFVGALRNTHYADGKTPALIAEVKKASPSRGLLAANFDPINLARIYTENGATAISVLTDEKYFQGHIDHLRQITSLQPHLPLLQKDFICDAYQVYEARAAGTDAILLIVAGLDRQTLRELHTITRQLGMIPLVEVHNLDELHIALECNPVLVGVNNRDLRDFSVSLETTIRLRPHIPQDVCLVAESGIHTATDVHRLAEIGVDAILVGEALVTAPDISKKIRSLVGHRESAISVPHATASKEE